MANATFAAMTWQSVLRERKTRSPTGSRSLASKQYEPRIRDPPRKWKCGRACQRRGGTGRSRAGSSPCDEIRPRPHSRRADPRRKTRQRRCRRRHSRATKTTRESPSPTAPPTRARRRKFKRRERNRNPTAAVSPFRRNRLALRPDRRGGLDGAGCSDSPRPKSLPIFTFTRVIGLRGPRLSDFFAPYDRIDSSTLCAAGDHGPSARE